MTTIITKNSSTASAVPAAGDLVAGELAVNTTDKKLYTKDSGGTVVKVVGSLGNQETTAVAITGGSIANITQTNGTINNTVIGASTAQTVRGTTVTATTGFIGDLTGNVTGNITGNVTGAVTGNVTGNLTGNVTASSGSSSFNNVTINGTLDMNSGTAATITGLATPTNSTDAATKGYVDTSVAAVVASAPGALDTLNELAAALGNDANFATTVTNSIATKLPLAGGTMSGAIAMGTSKITGLGTPTAGTDATTKTYVDNADALKLNLTGGTLSGALAMGTNKITGLGDPSANQDAATKVYVDGILGSATSAATSAANALTSANNAATSASGASTSAASALSSLNTFRGQYYGTSATNPTLDPLGAAIGAGDLYWNTTVPEMRVYTGAAWISFYPVSAPVDQTDIGTAANEIPLNQYLGKMAYKDVEGLQAQLNPAPTIASAATIQPLSAVTFISGTTTINTITVPAEFVGGGQITLIPTGLWSTGTSGNIAIATTGVVSKALIMTYDATTAKWYPSY